MGYKLGYVADRVAVPSKKRQTERLVEYGVTERDVYTDLENCLGSLREGDTLVVYTTAILGKNKLHNTFTTACNKGAVGIYSVKAERFYDCQHVKGMKEIEAAWRELEDVSKRQMAEVGRQKGGRKQGKAWKHQDEINKLRNEGVTIKRLAEIFPGSEATIRRMLK